jgi:hypothetical protein
MRTLVEKGAVAAAGLVTAVHLAGCTRLDSSLARAMRARAADDIGAVWVGGVEQACGVGGWAVVRQRFALLYAGGGLLGKVRSRSQD